ncbi:MAG: hypothetical protein ACI3YK_00365 [Eubacteriales bacterium]
MINGSFYFLNFIWFAFFLFIAVIVGHLQLQICKRAEKLPTKLILPVVLGVAILFDLLLYFGVIGIGVPDLTHMIGTDMSGYARQTFAVFTGYGVGILAIGDGAAWLAFICQKTKRFRNSGNR